MTRSWVPWTVIAVAVLLVGVVTGRPSEGGPPLDPDSTGERGTRALVELIERFGAEVRVGRPRTTDDVTVLLADRLDDTDRGDVLRWVRAGGTLVVTDPGSPLAGVPTAGDLFAGLADSTIERGACGISALAGLDEVAPGAAAPYVVDPGAASCFGDGDTAFVVASDRGRGTIVSIGGAAIFTNRAIGDADNAALATALLSPTPGRRVAFVDPLASGTGEDGLGDLVPTGIKLAIAQLAIAFVVYALWRAIRLGRPVLEPQLVQLEGSELVRAVGNLLHERHDVTRASERLAADARDRAARATGSDPADRGEGLASLIAERTGREPAAVATALDPTTVTDENDLVRFADRLDSLLLEVLHGRPDDRA